MELGLAAIRRAEELSEGADATVLATLARVLFLRGDIDQAIDAQQRAVGLSEPPLRDTLQKALEDYTRAKQQADR